MASRRVDADEDVALVNVDNAAAALLFSPNIWVHRPSRPARTVAEERDDGENLIPGRAHTDAAAAAAAEQAHTDPDFAYLETDENESSQREHAEQDMAHIAQLEAELARATALHRSLQEREQAADGQAAEALAQSSTVKRLLVALQVQREDLLVDPWAMPAEQAQRHMATVGRRLLANLTGGAEAAQAGQRPGEAGPPGQTPAAAGIKAYRGAVTTPRDYPAESQIAAAALLSAKGDFAEAVMALLTKALGARAPSNSADGQAAIAAGSEPAAAE